MSCNGIGELAQSDGTCICAPGYIRNASGACEAFDYSTATGTPPTDNSGGGRDWQKTFNEYGPVLLGGIAAWWASRNESPPTTYYEQQPVDDYGPSQRKVPIWAWVAGGLVLVIILVAVLRRRK
jgi:hypothetical protein